MADKIIIETDHPIRLSTTRPVAVQTVGGVTTVTIDALVAPQVDTTEPGTPGLVHIPQEPDPAEKLLALPDRCAVVMKRSGQPCARLAGHNGVHQTAATIMKKRAYDQQAARAKYRDDPGYAERMRADQRASYARRNGGTD